MYPYKQKNGVVVLLQEIVPTKSQFATIKRSFNSVLLLVSKSILCARKGEVLVQCLLISQSYLKKCCLEIGVVLGFVYYLLYYILQPNFKLLVLYYKRAEFL